MISLNCSVLVMFRSTARRDFNSYLSNWYEFRIIKIMHRSNTSHQNNYKHKSYLSELYNCRYNNWCQTPLPSPMHRLSYRTISIYFKIQFQKINIFCLCFNLAYNLFIAYKSMIMKILKSRITAGTKDMFDVIFFCNLYIL